MNDRRPMRDESPRPDIALLLLSFCAPLTAADLPARYFPLLEPGSDMVEARLNREPGVDLNKIESQAGWRHFPYAILAPAVLYSKQHPTNPRYDDPKMRGLAIRIGDLLAAESEKGAYAPRQDSD
jgi:hypothetical protein